MSSGANEFGTPFDRTEFPMRSTTEKVKHTGGPWRESHQLPEGFSVAHEIAPNCGHLLVVATCGTQKRYLGHEIDEDTARANARLIAASPEMLRALEQMLAAYAPKADWTKPGQLHSAVAAAIAAIRRAKGE